MTVALRSSTRVREVWSIGGPFPLPASRFPTCKIFNSKSPFSALRFSSFEFRISNSGLIPEPLNPLTPSRCHRGRAFSLVELLAVVGIIAILSVAAVPVMRGLGGSQSSRATAQILISALEQARTAAILSGTNAYLVFPGTAFPETNYQFRSYALVRPKATNHGGPNDDFLTNNASSWILLSKWERLPGDLQFSADRLASLTNLSVSNLTVPRNPNWQGSLPAIGFTPSGGLTDQTGANGLLFASSNKIAGGKASVADQIEISQFSGRVRYTGLVTNTNF
jgi:prepilin-type N-terminal cleavage/methylation domain-containing protein